MLQNDKNEVRDNMSLSSNKGMNLFITGEVNMRMQLFDEKGVLKQEEYVHNTVTNAGKYGIADQILASPTLAKAGWCAIGTGTPQATLLQAEVARVAFDTKTRVDNVVTMVTTFVAGVGTGAITEAGIFDVVTANTVNMWCSGSFSVINKGAADALVITWTITIS